MIGWAAHIGEERAQRMDGVSYTPWPYCVKLLCGCLCLVQKVLLDQTAPGFQERLPDVLKPSAAWELPALHTRKQACALRLRAHAQCIALDALTTSLWHCMSYCLCFCACRCFTWEPALLGGDQEARACAACLERLLGAAGRHVGVLPTTCSSSIASGVPAWQ